MGVVALSSDPTAKMPPIAPTPDATPPAPIAGDDRRPASKVSDYDFESVIWMLSVAIWGTALAGAAFPLILGICELAFGFSGPVGISDLAFLFPFGLLGGMVGGMLALTLSVPVAVFAGVVAWLSRINGRDVWFASLVGGWTGYFATHLILESFPMDFSHWVVIGLAVAVGQIGAGGLVIWARRRHEEMPVPIPAESEMRFGLRQLFGITTAVAILVALGEALRIDEWAHAPTSFAAAIQATIIAVAVAVRHFRQSPPGPENDVSREAPTPPAQTAESTLFHVKQ